MCENHLMVVFFLAHGTLETIKALTNTNQILFDTSSEKADANAL